MNSSCDEVKFKRRVMKTHLINSCFGLLCCLMAVVACENDDHDYESDLNSDTVFVTVTDTIFIDVVDTVFVSDTIYITINDLVYVLVTDSNGLSFYFPDDEVPAISTSGFLERDGVFYNVRAGADMRAAGRNPQSNLYFCTKFSGDEWSDAWYKDSVSLILRFTTPVDVGSYEIVFLDDLFKANLYANSSYRNLVPAGTCVGYYAIGKDFSDGSSGYWRTPKHREGAMVLKSGTLKVARFGEKGYLFDLTAVGEDGKSIHFDYINNNWEPYEILTDWDPGAHIYYWELW